MNYWHLAGAILVWLVAAALAWAFIDDGIDAHGSGPATAARTAGRLLCINLLLIVGFYVLFGHMALNPAIGFGALAGVILLIW